MALENIISRAKKSLKSLAYAGVIGLALAGGAREAGADVNSNSKIINDIELYMQTDKSVYDLGENVEMLYRVKNLGEEDVSFDFYSGAQYDFIVESKIGENFNEIWRWNYNWAFYQIPTSFSLSPNEFKEFMGFWSQIDAKGTVTYIDDTPATIGTYRISGVLFGYEGSEVSVDVNIIPEPTTIGLLSLGGAILALSKKRYHPNK